MSLDINALSPSEQQKMRTELNEVIESMEEHGRDFTAQLDRLPSSAECYKGNPEDLKVELKENISSSLTVRLSPSHHLLAGYQNEIGVADGHEELGFDPDNPVTMSVLFLKRFLITPLRDIPNWNREMEAIQAENPSVLTEVAEHSLDSSKELSEMAATYLERKSQIEVHCEVYKDAIAYLRRSVPAQQRNLLAPLLDLDKALVNCLNEQPEGDDPEKLNSISHPQRPVVQDLAGSGNVVSEDSMLQESPRGEGGTSVGEKLDKIIEFIVKRDDTLSQMQQSQAKPDESNIEQQNDIMERMVLFMDHMEKNSGLVSDSTADVQCDDDLQAPDPNSRLSVTIDPPKVVFDDVEYTNNIDSDMAIFLFELEANAPATVSLPELKKREYYAIALMSSKVTSIKKKIAQHISEDLASLIIPKRGSGSYLNWNN